MTWMPASNLGHDLGCRLRLHDRNGLERAKPDTALPALQLPAWPERPTLGVATYTIGALRLLNFTHIADGTRWARDDFHNPLIALGHPTRLGSANRRFLSHIWKRSSDKSVAYGLRSLTRYQGRRPTNRPLSAHRRASTSHRRTASPHPQA